MGTKTKKKTDAANDTRVSIFQAAKSAGAIDALIGLQLRKIRKAKKLTQQDIAQGLRITYQQVQKYESGRNRIAASTLYHIATLLDRPIDDFFQLIEAYLKEPKN